MMDDDELIYREMNEEDPYYMGPLCDSDQKERDNRRSNYRNGNYRSRN